MSLTPEECRRIYEEERTRLEAQDQLRAEQKKPRIGCLGIIGALFAFFVVAAAIMSVTDKGTERQSVSGGQGADADSERWTPYVNSSPMDGSVEIGWSVRSEPTSWFQSKGLIPHIPKLYFRCRGGHTEAFIDLDVRVYVDEPVRIRFDDDRPQTESWNHSRDYTALFAPHPIALAKRVAKAKRMLVEVTPSGQNAELLEFDVSGFDKKIGALAEACNWGR